MNINFRHEINGIPVITAIAQDAKTNEILMLANMNKEALIKTIQTGKAHYWSTSRNQLWLKGESSGHFQAIILKITQTGAACHEGYESCFFRRLKTDNKINIDDLSDDDLEIILERIVNPEDVY